eukprot:3532309-Heterocapsa_arctica.AAC.1
MPLSTSAAFSAAGWPPLWPADLRKKGRFTPGAAPPSAMACPAAPLPRDGRGAPPRRCRAASH